MLELLPAPRVLLGQVQRVLLELVLGLLVQAQALLEPLPAPRVLLGQVQRVLLLPRKPLITMRAPPWRPELK